jgi:hypothetical protein
VKQKIERAENGETTQNHVLVHWRSETHDIAIPERQMSKENFERLLLERIPGLAEARYEIEFWNGQTY